MIVGLKNTIRLVKQIRMNRIVQNGIWNILFFVVLSGSGRMKILTLYYIYTYYSKYIYCVIQPLCQVDFAIGNRWAEEVLSWQKKSAETKQFDRSANFWQVLATADFLFHCSTAMRHHFQSNPWSIVVDSLQKRFHRNHATVAWNLDGSRDQDQDCNLPIAL